MREEYLIRIHGVMEQDDDRDSVELMTRGSFVCREGSFYITYKETEATGYDGCTTVVRVNRDQRRVSMLRYGKNTSQLVIEKGVRHICHYETGFGSVSLGVAADEIAPELSEAGGRLRFSYTLDSGGENFISRDLVDIRVEPLPDTAP